MKKLFLISIALLLVFFLNACYKDRTELFDIPIVASTYVYLEEEPVTFLSKEINFFSITFSDTSQTTDKISDYDVNLFGDFSFQEIKLFNIVIEIEFDGVLKSCNSVFMGIANPQRPNAYRLLVTIDDLSDKQDVFQVVLDFDRFDENYNGLQKINVQIIDEVNSGTLKNDVVFDVTKETQE